MAKMQNEQALAMAEKGYIASQKVEEIKLDEVNAQTYAQERTALYEYAAKEAEGASQWVINARAMVRPGITYGMFALLAFVDVFGFYYAIKTGVAFDSALDQLWDDDSQQIFASIIAFYFGGQAFKK